MNQATDSTPAATRRLVRHLVVAVILKLIALSVIWWFITRDHHTPVTPESVAGHIHGTGTLAKEQQ